MEEKCTIITTMYKELEHLFMIECRGIVPLWPWMLSS